MNLDIMLQALFEQVKDIYNGTINGSIKTVEVYTPDLVGVDGQFTIGYEKVTDSYTYTKFKEEKAEIKTDMKIRFSTNNLFDETFIYTEESGAVSYREAAANKNATKIQYGIITNVSYLSDMKDNKIDEEMQTGRGSR